MKFALAAILALAAAPALAQGGQQLSTPSQTQNQSQAMQNENQQPAIAKESAPGAPVATENSVIKPQGPVTTPNSQGPRGRSQ